MNTVNCKRRGRGSESNLSGPPQWKDEPEADPTDVTDINICSYHTVPTCACDISIPSSDFNHVLLSDVFAKSIVQSIFGGMAFMINENFSNINTNAGNFPGVREAMCEGFDICSFHSPY